MIMIDPVTSAIIVLVTISPATSMYPTYHDNDVLNVCKPDWCAFNDVSIGDIVYFVSVHSHYDDGKVLHRVIHRVIDIWKDCYGSNVVLITQGDNRHTNPYPIAELDYVTVNEYRGKVLPHEEMELLVL